MSKFQSRIESELDKVSASERRIISEAWEHRADYIKWPARARLLWPGCVRIRYHRIPDTVKEEARAREVPVDSRSNGPAVMAFLLACMQQ